MLDEFAVKKPAGFPDHPHRGFETVTYMMEGSFKHEDFTGRTGVINPGDLQWMTAGRGIMHSELPASDGYCRGLQLWVNLASKDKMVEPAYQELEDKEIPRATVNGVTAKVIAGEAFGVTSPVRTRTPTMYIDFRMEPNTTLETGVPEEFNAFVYTIEGSALYGTEGKEADAHHTLVLSPGSTLTVKAKDTPVRFVLIGGRPIKEHVEKYGPFVMNTRAELMQAMQDFQMGRNGFENVSKWTAGRQ